ncbi:unnamed protein product, partial [Onchocerca flexuosa]|uniref:Group-specific protein n=2 Tax=Onchocerca flexuosa TaxID=387005 RepID=A0A183HDK2_9BILA
MKKKKQVASQQETSLKFHVKTGISKEKAKKSLVIILNDYSLLLTTYPVLTDKSFATFEFAVVIIKKAKAAEEIDN